MARYSGSVSKASGAAAAWLVQFRTSSTKDARIWEIHAFAESAVAGTLGITRSLTTGTITASTSPVAEDSSNGTATSVTIDTTASVAPTQNATPVYFRRVALPATIGSGIIWQFPTGLVVPVSAGLLVWQLSAAAVTYGITFVYDE